MTSGTIRVDGPPGGGHVIIFRASHRAGHEGARYTAWTYKVVLYPTGWTGGPGYTNVGEFSTGKKARAAAKAALVAAAP